MKNKYNYIDEMPWEEWQESNFSEDHTENLPPERERIVAVEKKWVGTGKKVLDIGSAWGRIASEIREQGNDVTVLDMPGVIEKARETHPELKFLAGSALDIPTEEKFDVILASEIIEHILDLDRFHSEINRVLKDDGMLIISTPNVSRTFNIVSLIMGTTQGFEYYNTPILHCRHFTPRTLAATLSRYNFKIIAMSGTDTGVGMDWSAFTEEEAECLTQIINKFTSNPVFRKGQICVLCKKDKK